MQGILNYVKAMDDGASEAEAFSANITRCSVAAQKYVEDAKNAGKSTEQITAGLKDAAKAGNGFKGVATSITSTLANMAAGMLVGATINLIIAGITNLVKAADEAKKKAVENARSSILCTPSGITISVSPFTFVYFFNTPLLI